MESKPNSRVVWYALQVKPRFEKVVSRNLNAKGFEEFLPTFKRRRQWSDRIKEIELPLFPGYVFCRFDINDRLPVLLVPGVLSIVGIGQSASAIDDSQIDNVRSVVASGAHFQPWPYVSVGQTVSIERGSLEGLEGVVVAVKNQCRLVISLPLLQRSVAVEIDGECVRPVSREQKTEAHSIRQLVR